MTSPTRLCILTGHSRGLGAAMAMQRLQPGTHLIGMARGTNDELAALATQRGAHLEQWAVDLAEPLSAAQRLRDALTAFDPARFDRAELINNAGAISEPAALRDTPLEAIARTLRIDLEATALLSAAFLDATRHWRGQRRVLNISSGLGRRPMASSTVYCAAKAGMDHLSRSLALEEETQPNGARIVSLAPGVIDTDMQVQLRGARDADFPDRGRFVALHREGQLSSADAAARRVLACLEREDFGTQPVADVRELG